jgi:ATP-dependent RNA helicase RhlE
MSFTKLGLTDQLVQGILATGYTAPTEIQAKAIPLALQGKDIIGCAQTGTGKTAAFVLPLLNRLSTPQHSSRRHVRALILTPTRELAQQVENFITGYGRFTSLQSLSIYGGVNMSNQLKRLARGVDIVIATPGRLLDHMQRRSIDLSKVEVLVLDEADRMFDMGFINDVRKIIAKVPTDRQTLLFSATMSKEVRALTASIQKHPEMIDIGERTKPVDTVTQHFYSIPQDQKMDLLFHILDTTQMDSVLVFSRTKHGADKISHRLERKGVKAVAIHSNRTQSQRDQALAGFKQGQFKVLVATDIAARGIDVEGISHVINYDTPTFAEDYIHRIGRTGRASLKGDALTFVSREEQKHLKKIEHFVEKRYELKRYPSFDYTKKPEVPAGQPQNERRRDERPHRAPSNGRPQQHDRRRDERPHHTPSNGRPQQQDRHRDERPHHAPSDGRPRQQDRTKDERPHAPSNGKPVHQQRHDSSDRRPWSNSPSDRYKQREKKEFSGSVSPKTAQENNWKKLLDETDEHKQSFRKKLKRMFKKD